MIKVRFQGAETSIPVTSPNMLCGEILVQAKQAFGLNPNRSFELKHKRNVTVDNSLPFRMSGIMANSTLDLVPKLASSVVSITIDFSNPPKRVTLSNAVLASHTLHKALQEYPGIESIRYANRVIHSADFSTVNLESLGLTSGTALFKAEGSARHEPVVASTVTATETVESLPTPPPLQQQPNFLPPALGEADLEVAKTTLVKIITNLLRNPTDRERLGKIRLAKFQEKTNYHPVALEFATKTLGFNLTNGGEDLVLSQNVSIENWQQHVEALQCPGPIIVTFPPPAPLPPPPAATASDSFDPFKTILSTSAPRPRLEDSNLKSYEDQVAELKQRRERLLAAHTHALDTRAVCAFASMADIPKPPSTQDHDELDDEETKVLARHLKETAEKQKKASQFQTRAMKEHAELVKSKVYLKTLIRIVLPNRTILQATFHTGERASVILSVISEHCTQEGEAAVMIGSGRPLVALDLNKSFFELGLFPAAFVHVMGGELVIREQVFALPTHANVPQGDPLVATNKPTAASAAAASKPKWLKLNKT